jgi:hypothetical protein
MADHFNSKLKKHCVSVSCDAGRDLPFLGWTFIGAGTKDVHAWLK